MTIFKISESRFLLIRVLFFNSKRCSFSSNFDLLPDRQPSTVMKWFQNHKAIKLVSRDRSRTFRKAIEEVDSSIIQGAIAFISFKTYGKCLKVY
ncbi:MAG: hypothetical protein ACQEWV_15385 [Bacillota bacterium]